MAKPATAGERVWGSVIALLPGAISAAAEICALPKELDDRLAALLLSDVGYLNGTSSAALSELKHLPFITQSGSGWRVSDDARSVLAQQLWSRPAIGRGVHGLVVEVIRARQSELTDSDSPEARRLQWHLAFNLAPLDAAAAIGELDRIVDRAASIRTLGDMRSVVALTVEQGRWLTEHALDSSYYEGRLAYEDRDYVTAVEKLSPVWESSRDRKKRMMAGHFLGAIWSAADSGETWERAHEVLEATVLLARDSQDLRGEAMILNTLGALLLRRNRPADRDRGRHALRRSIALSGAVGDRRTEAYARLTLASALMKDPRREARDEAEIHLRQRLELERGMPDLAQEARATQNLGRLLSRAGPARRQEATDLLRESVSRARSRGDARQLAFGLEALGAFLSQSSDPSKRTQAVNALTESLSIGRQRNDLRHQAIVLVALASIAEQDERFADAVEMLEEVVELNLRRGDHPRADEIEDKARRLRRRIGREGHS